MRKIATLILGVLIFNSCIPTRIAPNISDYKLVKGKRFKKGLPKKTTFVFEDPKDADHFYNYINTKYQLDDYYVDVEVPFEIDGEEFFFSFYEVEKSDKGINLIPVLFDLALNVALGNEDIETYTATDETVFSRTGNWYIAIEVFSETEKDCLHEDSVSRDLVLAYLRELKKEYLATHNYNEVVFKN